MTEEVPKEVLIKEQIVEARTLIYRLESQVTRKINAIRDRLDVIDGLIQVPTTVQAALAVSSIRDSVAAGVDVAWPNIGARVAATSIRDFFAGVGEVPMAELDARLAVTSTRDAVAATAALSSNATSAVLAATSTRDEARATATSTVQVSVAATAREDWVDATATVQSDEVGVGMANPSLGFNFGGLAYWQSAHPFLNLVKAGGGWIGHRPGQWGGIPQSEVDAVLDADGWPTAIPSGAEKLGLIIILDHPSDPLMAGQFRVRWTGTPNFSINGGPRITSGTQTTFSINQGQAIMLDLYAPGIRDLSIVPVRHTAAYDNGEIFNPDWINLIRDFRTIRFMNWHRTNGDNNEGNQTVSWSQRTRESYYSWTESAGIPIQVAVKLANRIGADMWVNVPHLADDNYIRQFAGVIRSQLDPRLRAFVEYTNEAWNIGMFGQAQWLRERALEKWPSATWEWMQYYAGRAVNMAKIFREVFAGQEHRLQLVLSSQTGQTDFMQDAMDAPLWTAEQADGRPPSYYFDVFAVTAYFGYGLGSNDNAQELVDIYNTSGEAAALNRAFELLQAEVNGMQSRFNSYRNMIEQRGMKMVMYEGGSHASAVGSWTNNATLVSLLAKVARDSRMGTLYTQMLNAWKAAGGQAFCLFTDVEMATKHGSWGHINSLSDRTPRWNAAAAWNAANPGYWETRDPTAFYDH